MYKVMTLEMLWCLTGYQCCITGYDWSKPDRWCNRYAFLKLTYFLNLIIQDVRQLCGSDLIVVSLNFGQPQHIREFRDPASEAFSELLAVRKATVEATPNDMVR